MHQKTKDIQKRYDGFLQTNCLWKGNAIFGLQHFNLPYKSSKINSILDEKLRLGKYIERFVSFELAQDASIEIVSENIQIQKEKITLGELDCILLKDKKPVHLEIIYKFYLFDASVGTSEIDHFIGPNRKDSLVEKLTKLKGKQLPLLYSNECLKYLKTINLSSENIAQQVYFKAQLFVPFSDKKIQLSKINNDCIVGFYSKLEELEQFSNCKFFIPIKKDWLVVPHENVNWCSFIQFKEETNSILERQFSPLCWLKKENGEIEKFFLVWW
ncbi:DUF1853 domain-containing protein [Polaribacter sp. ALD11]|uniref:DUF1853 family protein n=1 Tax=Polaribacter sp. ALD11 TaxID=2058137 RepID=UPI000C318A76|nr:DUF1853 family protein [Polaribacter sp. ALD11]AUC84084.1 DUF1853 domain-containing protein [Polaribacter sp. ALD11]